MRSTPPYPEKISIEVTNTCNLDCRACCHEATVPAGKARHMSWSTFERIEPLLATTREVFLFGFGEPLLHPQLIPMLDRVKTQSGASVRITTNGTLLKPPLAAKLIMAGIDTIVVSLDGATEETVAHYRDGTSLHQVLEHVRWVTHFAQEQQKAPAIGIEFVAAHGNIEELPQLVRIATDCGLQFIQVSYLAVKDARMQEDSLFYHQALATNIFNRARQAAQKYGIALRLPPAFHSTDTSVTCREPWTNMFVGCRGEVYVCCVGGRLYRAGNINSESPHTLWHSTIYETLRANLAANVQRGPCEQCFYFNASQVTRELVHIRATQETARRALPLAGPFSNRT